ncbi:Ribonuclease II/R [Dillenia turbinata]|uniref:DIS3-like exonuclease 2 n=1 Tax=Dillenia turbinata TaxID=194707 RepID=A0AAN8W3L1_9MAGN
MVVEQSQTIVVERVDESGDKKDKKKRRPRRSKQNSSSVSGAVCSSVNELHAETSESSILGSPPNCVTSSVTFSSPGGVGKASNVAFGSMPPMHISEQPSMNESIWALNQGMPPSDHSRKMFSKSCPEPVSCEEPIGSYRKRGIFPPHQVEGYSQKPCFEPHWPVDAVNEALERGDVFRALFRVNAHNRLEAYCTIDGVPSDVLINGIDAQNRAVEGDVVAVKVNPFSSWTKMKGSAPVINNSNAAEDCNLFAECPEMTGEGKGKNKVGADFGHFQNKIPVSSEASPSFGKSACTELLDPIGYDNPNGHCFSDSNSSYLCSSIDQQEVKNVKGRICALISSFPSKRPTGRVVAIIEKSPRRGAIVGFLSVKQWLYYKKDTKKNKHSLTLSDREYIQLTPTDPKFPRMMVPMKGLPDCLKKRLREADVTVEMDLVAAQIDDWSEESPVPQAYVIHVFGRGGEIESQIAAILFENAINSSEFSPESLSCLPHLPWEVPEEELHKRKDLRNLCVCTIDPSTATDLDDALSIEMCTNGIFRVGVHIADVSYFVLPHTFLDAEAQLRSTSVYMSQGKLPMLPPLLSEDIGSLSPGVDRLAFSIIWDITSCGSILDRWIGRTVIRSCCKLSYEHAQDIIDGVLDVNSVIAVDIGLPQLHGNFEWPDVIRSVKSLYEISKVLKENRFNDGALTLDSLKINFLFDEFGVPFDSMFCGRKDSNLLVEEFMLLANRTAAEVISRAFPGSALLRRHPEPNLRKLKEFEAFCGKHGLELDTSSSGRFRHSLEKLREKLKNDSVLFDILVNFASKPMQLATYFCSGDLTVSENDWGHYALAVPLYTHFTSPLRRYPDILVHRTLAAALDAEDMYLKRQGLLVKFKSGEERERRCFTGICFDKDAAESNEVRETLSASALKHGIPCAEILADIATYCNDRKLASRHVNDAMNKLYMWVLLKNKEILLSEARVLGLGPKFMSIYIQKLAIERRIYYDDVEGLVAVWLETTSTLVLSLSTYKCSHRRGSPGKSKALEEVALVTSPYYPDLENCVIDKHIHEFRGSQEVGGDTSRPLEDPEPISRVSSSDIEVDPAVFPLTVRLLSTIPVALHALGGDDGPLDIGARLYMSSYFW